MNKLTPGKWLLIAIGILSVGLATIGIFVPLLPTAPFLLLASACFIRSSERLYQWLITHRIFGSHIKNYRDHRAITRKARIGVLILLWVSIAYTAFGFERSLILRLLLLLVAVGVTIHVMTLKTLPQNKQSGGK
jgi:hypothetical protein